MLLGIDVSKWQLIMNWLKARSAGARFAFVRAGSITSVGGDCYTDYQFETNARIAPEYMPIGFYWYFRPQFDPVKQANYFCNLIRDKRWRLPPVLDLETTGGISPEAITTSAKNFILQVYNQLNTWCLLYSRAMWLNANTVEDTIWEYVDLWVARYINLKGPWDDGNCIPRDWDDWKFWQFSAGGNGRGPEFGAQSRSIDLNYFNGDEEEFNLYIGAASPPHLIRITFPLVTSMRSVPEGPAIGATWRGTVWPIVEISENREYYKVEAWIKSDRAEEI